MLSFPFVYSWAVFFSHPVSLFVRFFLPHSSKGPHVTIYYWNANLSLAIRVNILYIEVIRHFVYDILASVCSLHTDHNIDVIVCGNYQLTLNHCMLLLAYWFCKTLYENYKSSCWDTPFSLFIAWCKNNTSIVVILLSIFF